MLVLLLDAVNSIAREIIALIFTSDKTLAGRLSVSSFAVCGFILLIVPLCTQTLACCCCNTANWLNICLRAFSYLITLLYFIGDNLEYPFDNYAEGLDCDSECVKTIRNASYYIRLGSLILFYSVNLLPEKATAALEEPDELNRPIPVPDCISNCREYVANCFKKKKTSEQTSGKTSGQTSKPSTNCCKNAILKGISKCKEAMSKEITRCKHSISQDKCIQCLKACYECLKDCHEHIKICSEKCMPKCTKECFKYVRENYNQKDTPSTYYALGLFASLVKMDVFFTFSSTELRNTEYCSSRTVILSWTLATLLTLIGIGIIIKGGIGVVKKATKKGNIKDTGIMWCSMILIVLLLSFSLPLYIVTDNEQPLDCAFGCDNHAKNTTLSALRCKMKANGITRLSLMLLTLVLLSTSLSLMMCHWCAEDFFEGTYLLRVPTICMSLYKHMQCKLISHLIFNLSSA